MVLMQHLEAFDEPSINVLMPSPSCTPAAKSAFLNIGGMGGAGLGGAAGAGIGAIGTFSMCMHMKKCKSEACGECPMPECVNCLESCGRLSALGGAVAGGIGGAAGQGIGSYIGNKTGGGSSPQPDASQSSGGMGAYSGLFDEWNTAPIFAMLHRMAPAGIDSSTRASQRRFKDYFDTDRKVNIS
mmetsp:Transcript_123703/g.194051  ORF Transcript_123703/g.194051 Transcript_123703/m.194051 type:complete len:185 (+) Transcript_123703:130-684(+)